MPKVPKKNISPILADVKWPKKDEAEKKIEMPLPPPPSPEREVKPAMWITLACFAVLALFGILALSASSNAEGGSQSAMVSETKSFLKNTFQKYRSFQSVSMNSLGLMGEVAKLETVLPAALKGENGNELIETLSKIRDNLKNISQNSGAAGQIGQLFLGASNPVYLGVRLESLSDFLSALIPWIQGDKKILVLFQNPSELRPAGGFLGSFAVLSIKEGSIKEVKVYDVNEADRELKEKIIPPKPIQSFSGRWFLRDSNWFFNFPDSAQEAKRMAESSDLFRKDNVHFDGVIAVSDKVLRDLLAVSGPVKLSGGVVLNQDNFLKELQKEVQTGRKENNQNPKQILKELVPAVLDKLENLSGSEREALMQVSQAWLKGKDVMVFFEDKKLQSFMQDSGWAGSVFETPSKFEGDYLAVVSSNMMSGKSDIMISRNIEFKTQINSDGTADDELKIKRTHRAGAEDEWWYRTVNESYFQIFSPANSKLSAISGAFPKKITYPKYSLEFVSEEKVSQENQQILGIPEVSLSQEYGRDVFGFWSKLSPGETKNIELDYRHRLFSAPADGKKYQFVFEKQSGSEGEYHFTFMAPAGFVWAENNLPVYEYTTSDPPGRINLELTFKKI